MRVVFTKGSGTSYRVAVERDVGAALAPRNGPGGHAYLPHDLVHFVVEEVAGIGSGVFGRLAAGENGLFWPEDSAARSKANRQRKSKAPKSTPRAKAEMERSELLTGISVAVWEVKRGHLAEVPAHLTRNEIPPVVERIVARLDDFADRWHGLPVGGSLTLTW